MIKKYEYSLKVIRETCDNESKHYISPSDAIKKIKTIIGFIIYNN